MCKATGGRCLIYLNRISVKKQAERVVLGYTYNWLSRNLLRHPGSVTPLCIMYDTQHSVKVLFDENFEGKKVIIHPLRNTASISITFDDLKRFIEHYGHTYQLADVYKVTD